VRARALPAEARQLVRTTGSLLSGRDLAAAAAATTYYAGIAVVPWLLLACWSTTWPLGGAGSVAAGRDELVRMAVLVPDAMGARPAYDALVHAGTGMGLLTAAVALFPASFYGEGIRRGCLALSPRRDAFTGWRARLALLPLVLLVLPLVWALRPVGNELVDLTGAGPWAVVLRVLLGFTALWLALTVPLTWIFHQVAPGHVSWPVAGFGALTTASFLAGFLHGFQLFLSLPIDLGSPFGGLGVVGGVVAVGLWLYVLHTVVLVGWVGTSALQEQADAHRAQAALAAGRPGATRAPRGPRSSRSPWSAAGAPGRRAGGTAPGRRAGRRWSRSTSGG
jgi:membrane protein